MMAQKSRPDPASGDAITADEYEAIASSWSFSGVWGIPWDTSTVYADSTGRQVKIRAGRRATVRGYEWFSDPTTDEIVGNLPANTSGLSRIDRLVLRLDRTARTVRTVYLQGVPSSNPVAPGLTNDVSITTGYYDIPLARWTVANGYTTVAAGDLVNEAWCIAPDGAILCNSVAMPFGAFTYPGMEAYQYDTGLKWIYCSDNTWRVSDWTDSWGLIGGQQYVPGSSFVIGLAAASGESWVMNSGTLNLKGGRRYAIRAWMLWTSSAGNQLVVQRIRETDKLGAKITYQTATSIFAGTPNLSPIEGYWDCPADQAKNFAVTMTVTATGGGTVDVLRSNGEGNNFVRCEVWDVGPSGKMLTV